MRPERPEQQLGRTALTLAAVCVVGYAGLALSQREFAILCRTGWKLVLVSLQVFSGTCFRTRYTEGDVLLVQGVPERRKDADIMN